MQQSNGKIKYVLSLVAYIVLVTADFVLTYTATPDLTWEANPLVKVFGLGWTSLIIYNTVILVLYAILMYYTFIRYKRRVIRSNRFIEYICILIYDCPPNEFKVHWLLFLPKSKIPLLAHTGYILLWAVIASRLTAITEWSIIIGCNLAPWMGPDGTTGHWYNTVKNAAPFNGRIDIVVVIFVVIYWLFREYRVYKEMVKFRNQD